MTLNFDFDFRNVFEYFVGHTCTGPNCRLPLRVTDYDCYNTGMPCYEKGKVCYKGGMARTISLQRKSPVTFTFQGRDDNVPCRCEWIIQNGGNDQIRVDFEKIDLGNLGTTVKIYNGSSTSGTTPLAR